MLLCLTTNTCASTMHDLCVWITERHTQSKMCIHTHRSKPHLTLLPRPILTKSGNRMLYTPLRRFQVRSSLLFRHLHRILLDGTIKRLHDAVQNRKEGVSAKGMCQNRTGQGKPQVHGALYTLVLCACSFARTCSALSSEQSGVMSCLDERVTASLGTNTSARNAVSCSLSVMLSPFNRLSARSLMPNRTDSAIKVSLGLNGTREHPTGRGKAGKDAWLPLDGWHRGGTGTFSAEDASCSSNGNGSAKKGSLPASAG